MTSSKGVALKMRTRLTIGLFLLVVAAALSSIQQSSLAFAGGGEDKNVFYVGKQDITTDIFELLSGIFAAILFVLSLRASRKLKIKGVLFVSAAFGIFAARTILIETIHRRRRRVIFYTVNIVIHVSYGSSAILYRNRS